MGRAGRETWVKRVEGWKESGLTAQEYAAQIGVNRRTLTYWKWHLGREAKSKRKTSKTPTRSTSAALATSRPLSFVELDAPRTTPVYRIELELGGDDRVRVADDFDGAALSRVLDVLEGRR